MSLSTLKKDIENMSKYHQIEVLRILSNNETSNFLNENQNGTFVNLTSLPKNAIDKLHDYCKYVKEQQTTLTTVEHEKQLIENKYFKDIKETSLTTSSI